jgi:hypothetical protein
VSSSEFNLLTNYIDFTKITDETYMSLYLKLTEKIDIIEKVQEDSNFALIYFSSTSPTYNCNENI